MLLLVEGCLEVDSLNCEVVDLRVSGRGRLPLSMDEWDHQVIWISLYVEEGGRNVW